MIKKGKKKIQGREIDLYVMDSFKKKVNRIGTSAHVIVPRRHLNREANIEILTPQPFVCNRCIETISFEENFSPTPDLCIRCYKAKEFLKDKKGKLKCKECGNKITEDEYKHAGDEEVCEKCLSEEIEEEELKNKR